MEKTIWGKDFDGPFIPIRFLLVGVPFFAMLLVSTERWQEYETKYRAAQTDRDYIMNEVVPDIDDRMERIEQMVCARQKELEEEYYDMMQVPPRWPDYLIADEYVTVPKHRRKQYVNYLAAQSKER